MKKTHMPTKRILSSLLIAVLAVGPASAGFFGPDVELLTPQQVSVRLRAEPPTLQVEGVKLDIRTKSAAVGGFLFSFVIGSVLASSGGGGATNAAQLQRQMDANMQIVSMASPHMQEGIRQLAAAAAGAQAVDLAQRGPLPLIAHSIAVGLHQGQAAVSGPGAAEDTPVQNDLVLKLVQRAWKLDFEAFSSDYVLDVALVLELHDRKADKIHLRHTCQRQHPTRMSLEDWERDEYLAIAQAAEDFARTCQEEFARALGFPFLASAAQIDAKPTTEATPVERPATDDAKRIESIDAVSPQPPISTD